MRVVIKHMSTKFPFMSLGIDSKSSLSKAVWIGFNKIGSTNKEKPFGPVLLGLEYPDAHNREECPAPLRLGSMTQRRSACAKC